MQERADLNLLHCANANAGGLRHHRRTRRQGDVNVASARAEATPTFIAAAAASERWESSALHEADRYGASCKKCHGGYSSTRKRNCRTSLSAGFASSSSSSSSASAAAATLRFAEASGERGGRAELSGAAAAGRPGLRRAAPALTCVRKGMPYAGALSAALDTFVWCYNWSLQLATVTS